MFAVRLSSTCTYIDYPLILNAVVNMHSYYAVPVVWPRGGKGQPPHTLYAFPTTPLLPKAGYATERYLDTTLDGSYKWPCHTTLDHMQDVLVEGCVAMKHGPAPKKWSAKWGLGQSPRIQNLE